MKHVTIGKLAAAAGLSVDTIRFYEKQRLIAPIERTESGYRLYDAGSLARLEFIGHAKAVGFTLGQIQQLLDLRDDPAGACAEVRAQGRQKLAEIDRRLAALTRMKATLTEWVGRCRAEEPSARCPILEELDGRGAAAESLPPAKPG